MELDTATLRVAFGLVAFTMLVLFYFVTYRPTRSSYSGWWCASLTWFIGGSAAFLLNGTDQQHWANPMGNSLLVLGAASAWAATRSLTGTATGPWRMAAAPLLTGIVSFADDPASDVWAGGTVFLAMMCLMFGLSARELWRMDRRQTRIRTSVAGAATLICVYYLARWIVFIVDGAGGDVFSRYFGSSATTIVSLVFLVAVSFSMTILNNEQTTEDLRARATQDGLTGLLNRAEFLRLATAEVTLMRRTRTNAALILADLDNFKRINDTHGHQAGDRALQAFAHACAATVRSSDLVGRYGGEEFILLLPGTGMDRAEQITREISSRLKTVEESDDLRMPTVSYGIVSTDPSVTLDASIASADAALYRAKTLGRNRAVREDQYPDPVTDRTDDDTADSHPSS
jgi:diguanylate cyclase (GGDEF)-like protein